MKKFVDFLISFAMYITDKYIVMDWDIYTKFGKIYLYPGWFYYACVVWLFCPIFLPEYFFKQSKMYKEMKKIQKSPEYKASLARAMSMFKFQ
jgi:hypothetical protein